VRLTPIQYAADALLPSLEPLSCTYIGRSNGRRITPGTRVHPQKGGDYASRRSGRLIGWAEKGDRLRAKRPSRR